MRSCHEDVILTREEHNCTGTAFVQGDSAGGSKLIEQTLLNVDLPCDIGSFKALPRFMGCENINKIEFMPK